MKTLDMEQLRQSCGDDPEFWAAVLDEFSRVSAEGFDSLKRAVADGDAAGALKVLHGIKGSGRTVGAEELAEMAAELETDVAREGIEALRRKMPEFSAALDRINVRSAELLAEEAAA